MNPVIQVLAAVVIMTVRVPALACSPPPAEIYAKTEKRVQERFDSVDSVVLAKLLTVRKVKFKQMGVDNVGEKATFQVARVFKGEMRPGEKMVFFSSSTCAHSVLQWDSPHGPIKLSRQWIIYRNASDKTEITYSDLTQPLNFASYDLKILPKIAQLRAHQKRGR